MKDFWEGFERAQEKLAAAPTWLAEAASRAMSAVKPTLTAAGRQAQHLKDVANMGRQSLSSQSYNPNFNIMRRAALATTGAAGIAYGGKRLAQHDVQQMSGQTHHPGLRQGPAM